MPSLGVSSPPPPVFSTVRIVTLLVSLLVSLGSGTNYVFSAYAPQLSSRLHLSHTQLNVVGLSGNIGVYGTAPLWGRIVDTRGPRLLLGLAVFALLIGYNGIRYFFDLGLPEGATDISSVTFCTLVLCGFLTGIGGNGGLASAMNATAKSFPDGARATVTGLVISGFGLSAFLFSTIAHIIFPGNTSDFLLVLAIGTSLPMVLGFFFVRPIPLPHSEYTHISQDDALEDDFSVASPAYRRDDARTHLLGGHTDGEDNDTEADFAVGHSQASSDFVVPGETGVALSPSRASGRHRSRSSLSSSRRASKAMIKGLDIRGTALASSKMFWLLFVITSLLSGTGLMYINNVGSISQALFAKGDPEFDERKAAQWQATQVSTISVANCLGRVLIGIIADFTKNNLQFPRSFCISLVAALFIVSQLMVFSIENVSDLWKGSALLGLAYGGMFGLFPTIVIEWFGLSHFSENWGYVSLSPMIGGNVFSIAFGRNLDAHAPAEPAATISSINSTLVAGALNARAGPESDNAHQCLLGRECYGSSLVMTTVACSLAMCLALYAGWKDYRRQRSRGRPPVSEVVWESSED